MMVDRVLVGVWIVGVLASVAIGSWAARDSGSLGVGGVMLGVCGLAVTVAIGLTRLAWFVGSGQ